MSSGERPIGAAKGKQSDTKALCQTPPPPPSGTKDSQRLPVTGDATPSDASEGEGASDAAPEAGVRTVPRGAGGGGGGLP